ncbi:MAG TPA: PQQ-dependent sugar dehydrogenase, partial [Actinoplanes sp.]|nr:PQQ-dependent sugar dehydrogenase [Actinoplanes sp.]
MDVVLSVPISPSPPTAFAFLPDGRVLIALQSGVVKLFKNGELQPTPFIDISNRVNDYHDHGLLGIAPDPNFATNGYIYLLYTYEHDAGNYSGTKTSRLARYTAALVNGVPGDTASAGSEAIILGTQVGDTCDTMPVGADCIPSDGPSHSVGTIKFAADGTMFVTSGDAASFVTVDDRALRSQNLDSLAGKVLHITTSGQGVSGNPHWTGNSNDNRSKVWARGLRNPYRFNLRPGNGVPYVGDVGWNSTEEVSTAVKGANLGWPCYEGPDQQGGYASKTVCVSLYNAGASAHRSPLVSWSHNDGGTCCGAAATGGMFYAGTAYPADFQDAYFYADYAKGWIRYLNVDANDVLVQGSVTSFESAADGPVDLELGADGNLYYLSIETGQLRRVRYIGAGNRPPNIVAAATPTEGLAPLAVQFSSTGTTDPDADPMAFSWDFGDGTPASIQPNVQHTYQANGTYTATLTVSDGRGGVSTKPVSITVGNRSPTATITQTTQNGTPVEPSALRYRVGDVIGYSGSATDPEDDSVAASGLAWQVKIQHCPGGQCHQHTLTNGTGASGSFTVPDHGDDSHFEIVLTATDSGGLTDTDSATLQPQTLQITLATSPAGLQVLYDGQTGAAPLTRTTVANSKHTIEAPAQGSYAFTSWSDGGAQQHDVTVATSNVTYTATLVQLPTVTFDDKSGQDQPLNGQYPTGVIDWGTGKWYHSGPFGAFTTKNVSFVDAGATSAAFTFVNPRKLLQVEAYNGGGGATTVTLSCAGMPTKQVSVGANQKVTIQTGWTGTCTMVTFGSSNGWNTNFDTIVYDAGSPPPPDTTPPVISAVQATSITSTTATITWTTNEASDSRVAYGTTASYGATANDPMAVTNHSVQLTGLSQNTTYHYQARSKDAAGNEAASADFTFTTAASDTTPPVLSAVQAAPGSTSATITWTSNEPATSQVLYSTDTSFGSATPETATRQTAHSVQLTGLQSNTTYNYRVRSKDAAGNTATSGDLTFTTTAAPATQTVTFDDKSGQDQPLNGQYPTGVIDWGTGKWYHS